MSALDRRTRNRSPRPLLATLAVVGLLLTACGSGDDDAAPDPPREETTTSVAPEDTVAPAPAPPPETTTTTVDDPAEPDEDEDVPAQPPDGEPELVWSVEYEHRADQIAMHPDGEVVAVAHDAAYILQLADGLLVDAVVYESVGTGYPDQLVYSADGAFLLAGLHVQHVAVSGPDGDILLTLPAGFEGRVALSSDATLLATSHRDGEITLWDATVDADAEAFTATERTRLPAPEIEGASPIDRGVATLEFTPDGALLVATHRDQTARVWDVASEQRVGELELDGEGLFAGLLRVSPDGTRVAGSVRADGAQHVRIWDATVLTETTAETTAEPIVEFEVLTRVRDLGWSPDGELLAVASRLGTTIWDPLAGELVYTFDEEFDAVASEQPLVVSFTPDGGHVLITRASRVIELWRLPGAEELVAPVRVVCEPIPLPGDVLFDTGSAALQPTADPVLEALAAELAATYDAVTLSFVGHTDSRGSAESNLQLSVQRAEAVMGWFTDWAAANGIDNWELRSDGRGDTELKVVDVDANGQFLAGAGQLNRRVEIEIDADVCA